MQKATANDDDDGDEKSGKTERTGNVFGLETSNDT